MSLKLVLRNNEENDKFYRRIIKRVEFVSACQSSESGYDIIDPIGGAMRDGDPETDSGTHRFFALFERREDAVAILRLDFAETHKQIDQLDDGRPTLGRLHLGDDLLGGK